MDVPIVVAFIYLFITLNFFGWGMLADQRFIFFSLVISFLYLSTALFHQTKRIHALIAVKACLLLLFIAVAVFGVTINIMSLRNKTSVEGFINDSGLQVEIAGRFLLLGKNPYRETYEKTDLVKAPYIDEAGNTTNPALFHNAYPPFLLLLSAGGFRIFSQLFHWFDIRVIYLLFYCTLLLLGIFKFGIRFRLVLFLILVGANPIFLTHMIQGSNDIVALAILFWSLFLLERKHFLLAGLMLGLAVATKQIAWMALPFIIFYAQKIASSRKFVRFLLGTFAVAAAIYLPFLWWDGSALWDDVVLYMSGNTAISYPIHNFGLGMFLVKTWMVPSIYSYYPFWIWLVAIGGLVVAVWWWQRRKLCTAADVLVGFSILLAVSWIFNRSMNFSYLGVLSLLVGIAALWNEKHSLGHFPHS